jgi:hypothetical protein
MRFVSSVSFAAGLIGVGSLLCAPGARSAEYSWQVSGQADQVEVGDSVDVDTFAARATYYVGAVDDADGPYALAAFLNHSSRLSVTTTRSEERSRSLVYSPFTGPIAQSLEYDSTGYALSGRHVLRSGWYAGASLDLADTDWPNSEFSTTDSELSGYGLLGGKYLGETTAVEFRFHSSKATLEIRQAGLPDLFPFPLPALSVHSETETEDFGLSVFHVGRLGRKRYSVSGEVHSARAELTTFAVTSAPPPSALPVSATGVVAAYGAWGVSGPLSDPLAIARDRTQSYTVEGELFPTVALGLSAGFARWDDDPTQDESYRLAATWFFKRAIAARFSLARTKRDLIVPQLRHVDRMSLELLGRF